MTVRGFYPALLSIYLADAIQVPFSSLSSVYNILSIYLADAIQDSPGLLILRRILSSSSYVLCPSLNPKCLLPGHPWNFV